MVLGFLGLRFSVFGFFLGLGFLGLGLRVVQPLSFRVSWPLCAGLES